MIVMIMVLQEIQDNQEIEKFLEAILEILCSSQL